MITVLKRNKVFCVIDNDVDYIKFLDENIYSGITSLTSIKEYVPDIRLNTIYNHTVLCKLIKSNVKECGLYPNRGSNNSKDYWLLRGFDINEIPSIISNIQKRKSQLCVVYWTDKGYSESESKLKISALQSIQSKKANIKRSKEFWIDKGYSESESILEVRRRSARCKEFWIDKGYSESESISEAYRVNNNSSLSVYIDKYGNEGKSIYNDVGLKKSNSGTSNGMYGKTPPNGAGRGISGYYKEYYFRSLYEYYVIKDFELNNVKFILLDIQNCDIDVRVSLPNNKTYRPDFLINNDTIIEVKPSALVDYGDNKEKRVCCEKQYPQYKYKYMTEKDINIDNSILISDIRCGSVNIDKGKVDRLWKKLGQTISKEQKI